MRSILWIFAIGLLITGGGPKPVFAAIQDTTQVGGWPSSNHSNTTSPFNKVFRLYPSTSMLDSTNGGWAQADVDSLTLSIFDNDSTNTTDVFPLLWEYFCHGDDAAAVDSVDFTIKSNSSHFTTIDLWVYDQEDFGCPRVSNICAGFGYYVPGTNDFYTLGARLGQDAVDPKTVASDNGTTHELTHLMDAINRDSNDDKVYSGGPVAWPNSELISTLGEYHAGARWDGQYLTYSPEYDVSLMCCNDNNFEDLGSPGNPGTSETRAKYIVYRLWSTKFQGTNPSPVKDMGYTLTYEFTGTHFNSDYIEGGFDTEDSPLIVVNFAGVSDGDSLELNGTQVLFEDPTGNPYFFVEGYLDATNVTFTSRESSPEKGDWDGLRIADEGEVDLSLCTIRYADIGLQFLDDATGTMDDSTIEDCESGSVWSNTSGTVA
ncbi:MAG: hypothetical protein HKN21_13870, partial [Candidatus Eisenbacteria bacterium]|nr:hypothetical protein [Candidatus Eisenbacteria bacterium]